MVEINSFVFLIFIFGLMITSGLFIAVNMSQSANPTTGYAQMNTVVSSAGSLNETVSYLNANNPMSIPDGQNVSAMQRATEADTSNSNPLNIALGLLGGAFNAIKLLFSLPNILMVMLDSILTQLFPFVPTYIYSYIEMSIGFVVVIGILYYYMKVK